MLLLYFVDNYFKTIVIRSLLMNSPATSELAYRLSEPVQLPSFKYSAPGNFTFKHKFCSLNSLKHQHGLRMSEVLLSNIIFLHCQSSHTRKFWPKYASCTLRFVMGISYSVSVSRLWLVKCWLITSPPQLHLYKVYKEYLHALLMWR